MKTTDLISPENDILKSEKNMLQNEVNNIVQVARANNAEIQGVPEKDGENRHQIVEYNGVYINHSVEPSSIDYTHRVQTNKTTARKIKNKVVPEAKNKQIILPVMSLDSLERFLY